MKLRACYPSRLCGLVSISGEFGTARCPSPSRSVLVLVDHLIDDHSTVDATPSMNHRGRTRVYDKAIIIDCEPIASLAIHRSPPDPVPSSTNETDGGIPGAAA